MPCFDYPFTLHIDASNIAIDAVLTYSHKDMDLFVAFFSKKLSDTEARGSVYECEIFSIIQALSKWLYYLINHPTAVFSDH